MKAQGGPELRQCGSVRDPSVEAGAAAARVAAQAVVRAGGGAAELRELLAMLGLKPTTKGRS